MKKKRKKAVLIVRKEAEDMRSTAVTESGTCVGDMVVRRPVAFGGDGGRPGRAMRGKAIFVHPTGRFHTVEFEMPGGVKIRESFAGDGRQ